MAQRDYAVRGNTKKKKTTKSVNKPILLIIALLVVAGFAAGLFFLKEKSPEPIVTNESADKTTATKSQLPSPPEEVWSYIKALETRTVPVDNGKKSIDKNMGLTEEQKKVLLAMEQEQKQAELARAKQAEELKKAEEMKKPESVSTKETVKAESAKTEITKKETKVAETKKAEVKEVKKADAVQSAETKSAEKKFGLQCGAFKNKAQAESMQARLNMAGFNARINSSADWNRVVVGPIGNRTAAGDALEKAKSVGSCVIIGM